MMGSLFSSISGMKNHTTWMNVIGNNISNVNTVGYKQSRITFKEAISQSMGAASGSNAASNLGGVNPTQMGLGSTLGSIDTVMTQGAIQTTGNATDVAIQGAGFFIAESGSSTQYTRAGNFSFDNKGNLVTSTGALVQGWMRKFTQAGAAAPPMVSVTETLDSNGPYQSIQIAQNMVLGPKKTGDVNNSIDPNVGIFIKGNLDSMTPQNATGIIAAGGYPVAGYTPDAVSSATVYDSLGNEHNIIFYWDQTANVPTLPPSWQYNAYDTTNGPISTAGASATTALNVGSAIGITFNSDGSLATNGAVAPNATPVLNWTAATLSNGALAPWQVSVFLGSPNIAVPATIGSRDGITGDFGGGTVDPTTGNYLPKQTVYTSFVDGYSEGTLTGVSVDQTGGINCSFSNNQIVTMAKLALANFTNPAGLVKAGGTMFMQSANSGMAQVSTAGNAGLGITNGGALEASNVDLSVELTNMIIAQRGFESNARIVTTSSTMLDTLVNLGR